MKQTIANVVAGWTPEERELHKDLIAECVAREKSIAENTQTSLKAIQEITEALRKLHDYFVVQVIKHSIKHWFEA